MCKVEISTNGGKSPIHVKSSIDEHPGEYFGRVLSNPPFGRKSSVNIVTEQGNSKRQTDTILWDEFWAATSNKQLNFVQHIYTILTENGKAAVIVPDNVLFEGGAGEKIRRRLLHDSDVHTLLLLPPGIFYAQGVKANVLFFDRKFSSEKEQTRNLWVYDFRTNLNLVQNTLKRSQLDEFVTCFNAENRFERTPTWSESNLEGRWRVFSYDELLARDKTLEDSADLPAPSIIAAQIVDELQAALDQFREIAEDLGLKMV